MKTNEEFTGWIIRFGGLLPSYYITDLRSTCHPSEAKVFMFKQQAEEKATELQREYTCGVSAVKADQTN